MSPSAPEAAGTGSGNKDAIVLCCDRGMFLPALMVATDAASEAHGPDVLVLVDKGGVPAGFPQWHAERGAAFDVIEVDFGRWLPDALRPTARLPRASAMRLMLPAYFDGRYRRLLFLDADLRLCGPVAGLFGLDLGGKAVAAVSAYEMSPLAPDAAYVTKGFPAHLAALGFPPGRLYFNSGVLLIDAAVWQAREISGKAIDFIIRNREACAYFDQDGLNAVIAGDYAVLSPGWNRHPERFVNRRGCYAFETRILHYYGPSKPWNGGWDTGHARPYERFFAGLWPGALEGMAPRMVTAEPAAPTLKRIARRLLSKDARHRIHLALGRAQLAPDARHPREVDALLARYLARTRFIDVEQGLTKRPWVARRYRDQSQSRFD